MLQAPEIVRESLNDLLDTLDGPVDDSGGTSAAEDRRRRLRRSFRTPCDVTCFLPGGSMTTLPSVTRNISFQGIAVLVPAELVVGYPIEVAIALPDQGPTYLAGVVAFCRSIARGHCEVGVRVKASGSGPIFEDDPSVAVAAHPWFAEAFAAVRSG